MQRFHTRTRLLAGWLAHKPPPSLLDPTTPTTPTPTMKTTSHTNREHIHTSCCCCPGVGGAGAGPAAAVGCCCCCCCWAGAGDDAGGCCRGTARPKFSRVITEGVGWVRQARERVCGMCLCLGVFVCVCGAYTRSEHDFRWRGNAPVMPWPSCCCC
jgi:hypothetical protein